MQIRVMENKYHVQFWKSVNANPTPMTFSEVYIGLQQGTIDAQENALPLIVTAKLYEQQKRLIRTNAVPDLVTLIASGRFMDSLTKEQAAIIEVQLLMLDDLDYLDGVAAAIEGGAKGVVLFRIGVTNLLNFNKV